MGILSYIKQRRSSQRRNFIAVLLLYALWINANDVKYDHYRNKRFAYEISYPTGIFIPQGEADNGDGQKFASKDHKTSMSVYGSSNALEYTLKALFQHEITGNNKEVPLRAVTYKASSKSWFVVSGTEGDIIFYTKVRYNKDKDEFVNFRITYPKSQRKLYDPLVSVVSKSMKTQPGLVESVDD